MASLTIRDLDDQTKERLRVRAARQRRSMEAEARHILREAVSRDDGLPTDLATQRGPSAEPGTGINARAFSWSGAS